MRLQDEQRDKGLVIFGVHVKAAVKDRALEKKHGDTRVFARAKDLLAALGI